MTNHLLGPADHEHFRISVGRFKERHYTDQLPACPILPAPNPEWSGPAITTVKKASGADWSAVSIRRIANHDGLAAIADLPTGERYDRLNSINRHGLNTAGGRGTIVHLWAEDMLAGLEPRQLTDTDMMAMSLPTGALAEALPYLPALVEFFDKHQPEPIATEVVCMHQQLNGVGYGGTADLFARVGGQTVVLDWKTRTASSNHGAYAEEAAQVAALAGAQYMIVGNGENAARAALPTCDLGLIVSIKPSGCKLYEIDLALAFNHWSSMHQWWIARRTETRSIKAARTKDAAPPTAGVEQPVGGDVSAPPTELYTHRDQITDRLRWLIENGQTDNVLNIWPDGIPGLKTDHQHTDFELDQIHRVLTIIEALAEAPFYKQPTAPAAEHSPTATPTAPARIDEGEICTDTEIRELTDRYSRVGAAERERFRQIAAEANTAGTPISVTQMPHRRRYLITEALIAFGLFGIDPIVIDTALNLVDAQPHPTAGGRFGSLTIDQAQQLGQIARALVDGSADILFTETGCTITHKENQ
jgi:hypothetical protein